MVSKRALKPARETGRDCSSYRFCFLRQKPASFSRELPTPSTLANRPITLTFVHHVFGTENKKGNQTIDEKTSARPQAFYTLFSTTGLLAAELYCQPHYIHHIAHMSPGREFLFDLSRAFHRRLSLIMSSS